METCSAVNAGFEGAWCLISLPTTKARLQMRCCARDF